ncbi:MAG: hypothetical protein OSB44_12460 [Verrucomicrobiales bacterium]|nr:hypothetical protein [Verrucomicrobiales bacterium]
MRKWRTTNQLIPKATLIFLGVLSPLLGFADKSTEEKKRWPFFKPENISVPKVKDADKIINDPDPNAYSTLVDNLLKDPRCGESWARFFMSL